MKQPLRPNPVSPRWGNVIDRGVFHGPVALGNSTQYDMTLLRPEEAGVFVGIEEMGAYTFSGWTSATYAAKKLGLLSGDAANVADLINAQLGFTDDPEQGRYLPGFCRKEGE